MSHAIKIRQTGGPEVLNWTPIEVGEPGSGQVRLRQAAAGLNYIDVYRRTGDYSQPLPVIPDLEGGSSRLTDWCALDCPRSRGLMVAFGQTSGPIDPIAPVLLRRRVRTF
jgi:hypothetical protein